MSNTYGLNFPFFAPDLGDINENVVINSPNNLDVGGRVQISSNNEYHGGKEIKKYVSSGGDYQENEINDYYEDTTLNLKESLLLNAFAFSNSVFHSEIFQTSTTYNGKIIRSLLGSAMLWLQTTLEDKSVFFLFGLVPNQNSLTGSRYIVNIFTANSSTYDCYEKLYKTNNGTIFKTVDYMTFNKTTGKNVQRQIRGGKILFSNDFTENHEITGDASNPTFEFRTHSQSYSNLLLLKDNYNSNGSIVGISFKNKLNNVNNWRIFATFNDFCNSVVNQGGNLIYEQVHVTSPSSITNRRVRKYLISSPSQNGLTIFTTAFSLYNHGQIITNGGHLFLNNNNTDTFDHNILFDSELSSSNIIINNKLGLFGGAINFDPNNGNFGFYISPDTTLSTVENAYFAFNNVGDFVFQGLNTNSSALFNNVVYDSSTGTFFEDVSSIKYKELKNEKNYIDKILKYTHELINNLVIRKFKNKNKKENSFTKGLIAESVPNFFQTKKNNEVNGISQKNLIYGLLSLAKEQKEKIIQLETNYQILYENQKLLNNEFAILKDEFLLLKKSIT